MTQALRSVRRSLLCSQPRTLVEVPSLRLLVQAFSLWIILMLYNFFYEVELVILLREHSLEFFQSLHLHSLDEKD